VIFEPRSFFRFLNKLDARAASLKDMTRTQLPSAVEALKDLVLEKHELFLQEHQRAEHFKYQLENLKRRYFGPSSEKGPDAPGQQVLFDLPAQGEPPAPPAAAGTPATGHGGGRRKLPPHLVRQRIEYALPEEQRRCPCCGEVMAPFGAESSEQLEFIPASLFVIEHVRIKYGCPRCQEKPLIAEGPPKVIDKGLAAAGLLAWNAVAKFGDHQPLYRQEDIFGRHGLAIPRSTQCYWLGTVAELLAPLYDKMAAQVKQSGKLHTDDTPIRVLDPGKGKTRTARFWVYVGDDEHPFTVFDYTTSRSRDGPEKFLKDFKGYLQADAYTGYDRICAGPEVVEVACWAHTRRKFFEARDTAARADELLALIRELYSIEQRGRGLKAAGRQQLRQMFTAPLLLRIKAWLAARSLDTLPKSPLGQAVQYALNQWTALTRFVEDGRLEPDNNLAENAVRPIALGRKNYLFLGNDAGGRRAAILYSLIRTCERHGVNAWEYLRDVLTRVSTHPAHRIAELLPNAWKPATAPASPPSA